MFITVAVLLVAGLSLLFRQELRDLFGPLRISHMELVKSPANRLRFEIKVNTTRACRTQLKYWIKGSHDTLYSTVSAEGKIHRLFMSNTRARKHYSFCVLATNGKRRVASKIYPVETQPIYQATPYFTLAYSDPSIAGDLAHTYFLTQILTEPGSVVIIDHQGDIVWYEAFLKGVKVSHWTKDRTVLCIVGPESIPSSGGDEIVELGLDGRVLLHLKKGEGDMDKLVHHEVRKDRDGNIYAMTFTAKVADLSSVKGLRQDTVKGDGIVLFNKRGKKLWEWSALDHLDPLSNPNIMIDKKDWGHGNALFRLEDGNFLFSFRDLNQIWKVAYPSGKVLWKFGEQGDFQMDPNSMFSAQHSIHITADGHYMLLDNGDKTKISRALVFDLDTVTKEAKTLHTVTLPAEYYSTVKGNTALFGKNRVLFCLTDPRAFLITTMDGHVLWKLQVGGDPYRLEEIPGFEITKPAF
ncbi:Arylsulfotransferase (ASST) [bacterium A37T11]|nr:Arylsulfotransferase (ASST) [bacterium A37T11]